MFEALRASEDRLHPPPPPLAARERPQLPRDVIKIPEPRLESGAALNASALRASEELLLMRYAWVDPEAAIVRIPIEQAMRLLADPKSAAARGVRTREGKERISK
jgi:hypothetical protein